MPRLVPRLFALLLAAAPAAQADDWPGPLTREVFSRSREYFVRVVPGESLGDTYGFAGAKKGRYAHAEFYRREADRSYRLVAEVPLLNPVAPYEFFVADDGRLATLDNWRNGPAYSVPEQQTLLVTVKEGAEFVFSLESGTYKYCDSRDGAYRCR